MCKISRISVFFINYIFFIFRSNLPTLSLAVLLHAKTQIREVIAYSPIKYTTS